MKHILLINPNHDTYSNPTIVSILQTLLQRKDLQLTLVAPPQKINPPSGFEKIKQIELPSLSVNWSKNIIKWKNKIGLILFLYSFCKKNKVTDVIGIDPIGLIHAGRIKTFLPKVKLHYFSFEIFFKEELLHNSYNLGIKQKEIFHSQKIDFLLTQDTEREKQLMKENQLNQNFLKTFLIPVSPNNHEVLIENKRSYWREKLSIPQDKIVLIHSGSMDKWSGADHLISLIQNGIPNHIVLLIHSKTQLDFSNPIHKQFIELKDKYQNIKIHETVFSDYQEYLSFLHIADLGLALYELDFTTPYTGKNLEYIGLSSGKFSCYISQNLPVLTNFSYCYSSLNERYNFGYVCTTSENLQNTIHNLKMQELIDKSKNCKQLFNDKLLVNKQILQYCSNF